LALSEAPAYSPVLRLTDRGVVLGKGTVIAALIDQPGGTALALDGQEERILTLLSVARQELVDPDRILRGLQTVSRALQKGDSSLAAIALCQLGQPPLADERLAKTLTWAECRLAKGRPAQTLLKMQGLTKQTISFAKEYDPNQPRVPGGNGKVSGEFASKEASDASMTPEQKKAELDKLDDAHDKALLAAHTYWDPNEPNSGPEPALPPGYRQVTDQAELAKLGINQKDLSPSGSSMHAELFVKDGQNGPQYIVAFRGTRPNGAQDWANDGEQAAGFKSEAYDKAEKLSQALSARTNGNLSFTGWSLGGGLASAAAVTTGLSATTFNSAGLDTAHISSPALSTAQVDAYYVPGEPLSTIQDNRAVAFLTAISAAPILTPAIIAQEALGHSVLPQAFGTRIALPVATPAGSKDYVINRHDIGWILSGIEARQKQLSGQ